MIEINATPKKYLEKLLCDEHIMLAESNKDLEEILVLQKLAYQSEAKICNDYTIQPLLQTIGELVEEAKYATILKYVFEDKIVGSVRAYGKEGTCYIGKLIVHPDYQNHGIGKKLLSVMESKFEGLRYELFTGLQSTKNIAFYEKMGYKKTYVNKINETLSIVYFEKYNRVS